MSRNVAPANPKLRGVGAFGRARWYPYYAGYSPEFVKSVLDITRAEQDSLVLDPWNGSGTTTTVCSLLARPSVGFDINPAMVVVAKARLVNEDVAGSVLSLQRAILARSEYRSPDAEDPLLDYFSTRSVGHIRGIQSAIYDLLVEDPSPSGLMAAADVARLSSLAALYLVILFRAVRELLANSVTKNPTWIRNPGRLEKKEIKVAELRDCVMQQATKIASDGLIGSARAKAYAGSVIRVADSRALPLEDQSVDLVITSPPYCTRIDYAVTTRIELALLGVGITSSFEALRRSMLGTTLVPKEDAPGNATLPPSASQLLDAIKSHKSKASAGYYFKTYRDYFSGLSASISELKRVTKAGGEIALVVQDSHYKDIHIDLAGIVTEQFSLMGVQEVGRWDFSSSISMRRINRKASTSRSLPPVESVLLFKK